MESVYPIQIGFVSFTFRGTNAKYPGRPRPVKMQKIDFISKLLNKPPKPREIHVPNSDRVCSPVLNQLGAYSLGAYSIEAHSPGAYSLGAYSLGAKSLKPPILGQAMH